jgi:hypothetical protein
MRALCFLLLAWLGHAAYLAPLAARRPLAQSATALAPARRAVPRAATARMAAPRDDSPAALFNQEAWTESGFDGLQRLPGVCRAASATNAESEHLLLAFLAQDPTSVVARTLEKAGSSVSAVKRRLDEFVQRQPKISGGSQVEQPSVNPSLLALVRAANKERASLDDDYLSGEHVLIAFTNDERIGRSALKKEGLDADKLRAAAKEVRGNRPIRSKSPETAYEALDKYTRDLTAEARAGKLDPVIGRDDEVRSYTWPSRLGTTHLPHEHTDIHAPYARLTPSPQRACPPNPRRGRASLTR